eukprot:COSAG02_NODE_32459_length_516_cov_0.551559_1_plen_65_part_01
MSMLAGFRSATFSYEEMMCEVRHQVLPAAGPAAAFDAALGAASQLSCPMIGSDPHFRYRRLYQRR